MFVQVLTGHSEGSGEILYHDRKPTFSGEIAQQSKGHTIITKDPSSVPSILI